MYLRAKLPLNPTAREFKPDVKSRPVSDLSSAPASEDKPKPVPTDSPKPACEAEEPKLVPEKSPRSVSEDETPKEVSLDSPKPICEDASHLQVSSHSPKPVPGDVTPTYWTHAHVVTGYCTYLPFRGFDITQTPPTYINVLPSLPQYTNIYTPLASIPSEYQLQRSIPVVPSFVVSDRPAKSAVVCFEGRHLNAEHGPGDQIAPETQTLHDPLETSVKSPCSTDGADTAHGESGRNDGHCGNAANNGEVNPERPDEVTDVPRTQVVAIQVSWSITHQEVNTEPYEPFEAQQGDISQIEKEHQVLQEQLKEAWEHHEQRKLNGSEEIRDLEEKLKRNLEENKVILSETSR